MKGQRRSKSPSFLIISIIAVTATLTCPPPRSVVRLRNGKPQIAKIQIKELEGAILLFRHDTGCYPTTAEGLDALLRNPGQASWRDRTFQRGNFPGIRGPILTSTGVPGDTVRMICLIEDSALPSRDSLCLHCNTPSPIFSPPFCCHSWAPVGLCE
jgi:hypothetical protein